MKIVVCIKQVPDPEKVKINTKTGALMREGVETFMNPHDKNAIEAAIQIKESQSATTEIILISMGPPQAQEVLIEGIAMGCNKGILLSDRAFAGSDTFATSYILSETINKIGDVDLVICGQQAVDGDTAHTGPQIAETLNMPQITFVSKITLLESSLTCNRTMENGYEVIETKLPAVIAVTSDCNEPRYPRVDNITEAANTEITVWSNEDIKCDPNKIGMENSPTIVSKSFNAPPKGECKMIKGENTREIAKNLVKMLSEKEIIQEY